MTVTAVFATALQNNWLLSLWWWLHQEPTGGVLAAATKMMAAAIQNKWLLPLWWWGGRCHYRDGRCSTEQLVAATVVVAQLQKPSALCCSHDKSHNDHTLLLIVVAGR